MKLNIARLRMDASDVIDILSDMEHAEGLADVDDIDIRKNIQRAIDRMNEVLDGLELLKKEKK